jgi:hypothetical protein
VKLFITAGIDSDDLYLAAERLTVQVDQLNIFDKCVIVTERDLVEIAPWLFDWYSIEALKTSRGYGFYAWKAAIAQAAMNGYWGIAEVICYLDAGCEVLPGRRSKRLMLGWVHKAKNIGVVGFSSFAPEWKFTKSELLKLFPNSEIDVATDQFQSGTWLLSGPFGKSIADEWNLICSTSESMTNDKCEEEVPGFIAHRHDQSVFSLVLKKHSIKPERLLTPYPKNKFLANLTAIRSPIWAARNRSGNTLLPMYVRTLARLLP